ncbi:hypothetical protein TNIN_237061 [Trichonephila inaurata madagascariensis]|uniref:DUF5641 domain-containing protein n=1 Tax=Trichonephila inaurata madagascariensis TaxID=2747483 RepID=A0A8X7CA80_9ARAC|nr:hypothetical protein TNIN_237061 [Trichonephila inaurata madagascariensis]
MHSGAKEILGSKTEVVPSSYRKIGVIQLSPGKDGHIRVARVKTETGELVRPVQRLYNLLELQEPEINLPKDLTGFCHSHKERQKSSYPEAFDMALKCIL